jgi:photosystem II stability/assembly factor-like uncharacterized protein
MKTVLPALCALLVTLALAAAPAAAQGWTQQPSGTSLVLFEIRMADADNATAVGEDGIILQSTNGGVSWTSRVSGTTEDLYSVEYATPLIGVIVGDAGVMRRTTDGGQTWDALPAVTSDNLRGISFTNGVTGTVVGVNGTILRSTNAGTTWTPVRGVAATLFEAFFVTADLGWVVGAGGTILKTTDGGETWTQQNSGTSQTLLGVSFTSPTVGTVVGTAGTIRRTTSGGASWASQTSGTTSTLTSIQVFSFASACITGNGGIILRTSNGGLAWAPQNSGTLQDLKEVSFVDENIGMVAGGGGTILKTTTGGQPPAALALSSPNGGESIPIGDTLAITWNATGFTTVTVELTRDAGGSWETLATGVPAGNGGTGWVVTAPVSASCKIRVSDSANPSLTDITDGLFSITPPAVTRSYGVIAGWNLVSVPLDVADFTATAVFPAAVSEAFRFDTAAGYLPSAVLAPGIGYWLKFDAPASISVTGVPREADTIAVGTGWNLIGAVSSSIPTSGLVTVPAGIIEGVLYGFDNSGYYPASTLEPGQAYWVKCTQPGQILMGAAD